MQEGSSTLYIDPNNKNLRGKAGDIVYCTHEHPDHTSGIKSFLKSDPDTLLITHDVVAKKFSQFKDQTIIISPNEKLSKNIWAMYFLPEPHGLFSGVKNIGIIVTTPSLSFAHPGDAAKLHNFNKEEIDVLAVPIGGMFTMSPKNAIRELAKFVKIPIIIPMHWLWRSPTRFCRQLKKKVPKAICIIPQNGAEIEIPLK